MNRISIASCLAALLYAASGPSVANAQRTVVYDTLAAETPAAVTCGFCAMEKFGVVFYELPGGGGLAPEEFPLRMFAVQVAVAKARVTGSLFTSYVCEGSATGGTVRLDMEIYAGQSVPRASIRALPADGPWPGETLVYSTDTADVEASVATVDGGAMYNVMIQELELPTDTVVDAPNTYLRVVFTLPAGGQSASCSDLGLTPAAAYATRDDDGRVAPKRSLIYALGLDLGVGGAIDQGWHWNEEISDPISGTTGINGDWTVRLKVTPLSGGTSDAGPVVLDGAVPNIDSGTGSGTDGGSTSCSMDSDCAGGELCAAGRCVRTTCATTADCAGGQDCVEGRCRSPCTTSSECAGGEICDGTSGVCTPVGIRDDGGCGCRVAGSNRAPLPLLGLLGLAAIVRRRSTNRTAN